MEGDENGNSSEGIVASSDDEYDGLSRAVEHHIIQRETETFVRQSRDTDWRNIAQPQNDYRRQPFGNRDAQYGPTQTSPLGTRYFKSPPSGFVPGSYDHHQEYEYRPRRQSPPPMRQSHPFSPTPHAEYSHYPRISEIGIPHARFEGIHAVPPAMRPRPMFPGFLKTSSARRSSPADLRRSYSPGPASSQSHHPPQVSRPYSPGLGLRAHSSPSPTRRGRHHSGDIVRRRRSPSPIPRRSNRLYSPERQRQGAFPSPPRPAPVHSPGPQKLRSTCSPPRPRRPYSPDSQIRQPLAPSRGLSPEREPQSHRWPSLHRKKVHPDFSRVISKLPPRKLEAPSTPQDLSRHNKMKTHHRNPLPVSFKIKPKPKATLGMSHPLDPLSDAGLPRRTSKSTSPDRWSHDKYEGLGIKETPRKADSPQRKRISPRRKRVRSASDNCSPDDSRRENDDKRPKFETTKSSDDLPNKPKNAEEDPQKLTSEPTKPDSPESGLIHIERDEETVYEEEVVIEDELVNYAIPGSAFAEDPSLLESDEDDEEILGLRLKALTSALNMENRVQEGKQTDLKKNSATTKKRKPKHLLQRLPDIPKRSSKRKSRRKSEAADNFVKKYRSISKCHSPERPRIVPGKPSPSQLTLFGEIVRNHKPTSKTETLRYIRSLPDDSKKTSMFLKLVKDNLLEEHEAIELIRQTLVKKKAEVVQERENIVRSLEKASAKAQKVDDNYDEIEMDLEADESDSDLVPPGTNNEPIQPPLSPSNTPGPLYTPLRVAGATTTTCETESAKDEPNPVLSTPSQESIWNMLEKPVEYESQKENENGGKIKKFNKERPRISSVEFDIDDDDALLLLRAELLEQINRSEKDEEKSEPGAGTCDNEPAPLTSQFPYHPPTLQTAKPVNGQVSLSAAPVTSSIPTPTTVMLSVSMTPALDSITELSASNSANITSSVVETPKSFIKLAAFSTTNIVDTELQPKVGAILSPLPAPTAVISYVPSGVPEEGPIANDLFHMNLTTPTFKPQMSSTPVLTPTQIPIPPKQLAKRGKRRRARDRKRQCFQAAAPLQTPPIISDGASGQNRPEKTGVLKPAMTNVSSTPKVHVFPAKTPSQSGKPPGAAFQTIVKTATTIIKTNATIAERQARKSSPSKPGILSKPILEKLVPILPRHQQVVINLGGSSDEEDSFLSRSKGRFPAKNPQELHRDLLDAMIKQVREQTTEKQKSEMKYLQQDKCKITTAGAHKKGETLENAASEVKRLPSLSDAGEIRSSCEVDQKATSKLSTRKTPETVFAKIGNPMLPKKSPAVTKANLRYLKQNRKAVSEPGKQSEGTELLKQSRAKFLKLKVLLSKDEILRKRLAKVKQSKEVELKAVEDELKEMIHRVAAINGKKARCEKLLIRYDEQEVKIIERMKKRANLKSNLEERIKEQWLKVRAEKRASKNDLTVPTAQQESSSQEAKEATTKSNQSSPSKTKLGKLDQEKQRLLTMEKELAEKINKMKNSDAIPVPKVKSKNPRRSSLSEEVQSHLARYQRTKKSIKPSTHDLSLSKITISASSTIRSSPKYNGVPSKGNSPNPKKFLKSPVKTTKENPKKELPAKVTSSVVPKAKINPGQKPTSSDYTICGDAAVRKLQNAVRNSMTNLKSLLSAANQPFADIPFASNAWEKPSPDCFKKWRLDTSSTPVLSMDEERKYEYQLYRSPLGMFRSYRLNPFFRVKEKLQMKSKTFSHKINTRQILCRYDLNGTCQDSDCKAQHRKQYELTPAEQLLDLISYCPALLGKEVKASMKYEDLVKSADWMCNKLCGNAVTQVHMSLDEKCIMIASKVNDALGNKPPYTTVFRPRLIKPKQTEENLWMYLSGQDNIGSSRLEAPSQQNDILSGHPDSVVDDERYFTECDAGHITKLEQGVKKNPNDIQLWLEVANRKMHRRFGNEKNRLELALHTMCLALEENPYVGELWAHYLGLLHHRRSAESDGDLDEMVSQAIELVPLSTHVWNQLFSWECSALKLEFLYDQLIGNLIKHVEGESQATDLTPEVASRWLFQAVLQRAQLQIHRSQIPIVISSLEITVKDFTQQCRWASSSSEHTRRCLSPFDLNSLWISFVNLKYFKSLPQCFFLYTRSGTILLRTLGVFVKPHAEVCLQVDSKTKLTETTYKRILADFNYAIKECSPVADDKSVAIYALLRERLRLERTQQQWESAASTCKLLCEILSASSDATLPESRQRQLVTEITITWADALVKNGDCLKATQVFDNEVTKQPGNARLCYEAALFQLNLESFDIEAALLYFETCISAYLDIAGEDCPDKARMKTILQHLLQIPTSVSAKPPAFSKTSTHGKIEVEKAYLWLIYCTLQELCRDSEEAIIDSYEKAIDDLKKESDQREIWLRYLRYRQFLAPSISGSGMQLVRARQSWLKNFTSVVRRCILTTSSRIPGDDMLSPDQDFNDYTFHNKVSSIYLSCFHTRQQMTTAYSFLTEMMPYNLPLLLRACRYFLTFGDHLTVISVLWKVTSNSSCQNKTIWKISVASHFSSGRIGKAIHLSKQAVEVMPYSTELWSDYLMLLKAYGQPEDFTAEKNRCSSFLHMDATRLLPSA